MKNCCQFIKWKLNVSYCASFKCITCTRFPKAEEQHEQKGGKAENGGWTAHENGSERRNFGQRVVHSLWLVLLNKHLSGRCNLRTHSFPKPSCLQCPANLLLSEPAGRRGSFAVAPHPPPSHLSSFLVRSNVNCYVLLPPEHPHTDTRTLQQSLQRTNAKGNWQNEEIYDQ